MTEVSTALTEGDGNYDNEEVYWIGSVTENLLILPVLFTSV
jgi:hypothetical protein